MLYTTVEGAIKGANALIVKLQNRIDKTPKKFCENYGQNEIRDFEDKLSELHYQDKCTVMAILYSVADMRPKINV